MVSSGFIMFNHPPRHLVVVIGEDGGRGAPSAALFDLPPAAERRKTMETSPSLDLFDPHLAQIQSSSVCLSAQTLSGDPQPHIFGIFVNPCAFHVQPAC